MNIPVSGGDGAGSAFFTIKFNFKADLLASGRGNVDASGDSVSLNPGSTNVFVVAPGAMNKLASVEIKPLNSQGRRKVARQLAREEAARAHPGGRPPKKPKNRNYVDEGRTGHHALLGVTMFAADGGVVDDFVMSLGPIDGSSPDVRGSGSGGSSPGGSSNEVTSGLGKPSNMHLCSSCGNRALFNGVTESLSPAPSCRTDHSVTVKVEQQDNPSILQGDHNDGFQKAFASTGTSVPATSSLNLPLGAIQSFAIEFRRELAYRLAREKAAMTYPGGSPLKTTEGGAACASRDARNAFVERAICAAMVGATAAASVLSGPGKGVVPSGIYNNGQNSYVLAGREANGSNAYGAPAEKGVKAEIQEVKLENLPRLPNVKLFPIPVFVGSNNSRKRKRCSTHNQSYKKLKANDGGAYVRM